METKRDIRARILEKRTHMTQEEWEFKSDLIVKRLMEHPFFVEAREIYCYMDYRREVGTRHRKSMGTEQKDSSSESMWR